MLAGITSSRSLAAPRWAQPTWAVGSQTASQDPGKKVKNVTFFYLRTNCFCDNYYL